MSWFSVARKHSPIVASVVIWRTPATNQSDVEESRQNLPSILFLAGQLWMIRDDWRWLLTSFRSDLVYSNAGVNHAKNNCSRLNVFLQTFYFVYEGSTKTFRRAVCRGSHEESSSLSTLCNPYLESCMHPSIRRRNPKACPSRKKGQCWGEKRNSLASEREYEGRSQ